MLNKWNILEMPHGMCKFHGKIRFAGNCWKAHSSPKYFKMVQNQAAKPSSQTKITTKHWANKSKKYAAVGWTMSKVCVCVWCVHDVNSLRLRSQSSLSPVLYECCWLFLTETSQQSTKCYYLFLYYGLTKYGEKWLWFSFWRLNILLFLANLLAKKTFWRLHKRYSVH